MQNLFPLRIKNRIGYTNLLAGIRSNNIPNHALRNKVLVHIVQIGAGGTGGYVAAEVLRYIGALPQVLKDCVKYTLIDGDAFEAKNLGRQLCTEDDLGVNKAEALINNLAPVFGADGENITALPKYIECIADLESLDTSIGLVNVSGEGRLGVSATCKMPRGYENPTDDNPQGTQVVTIYLDCVDKTLPRRVLHTMLEAEYRDSMAMEDQIRSTCNNNMTYMNVWSHEKFFSGITQYDKDGYAEGKLNPDMHVEVDLDERANVVQTWTKHVDGSKYTNRSVNMLNHYRAFPVYPETYIISSGNGQYTGQVYWGRYSRVLNCGKPIRYSDVYGDQNVSAWAMTDANAVGNKFIESTNILENKPMWPLVAKYKDNTTLVRRVMESLFMTNNVDGTHTNYDKEITDGMTQDNVVNPVTETFENFVAAHISVPSPYIRHPELIDPEVDEREAALSCADRAAQNIQNIHANKTAAQLVINYFNAIMSGIFPLEASDGQILSTVGVTFDIRNNNIKPEFASIEYFRQYETDING